MGGGNPVSKLNQALLGNGSNKFCAFFSLLVAGFILTFVNVPHSSLRRRENVHSESEDGASDSIWLENGAYDSEEDTGLHTNNNYSYPAVLICNGDLGTRIQILCTSKVLTEFTGMQLRVIWTSDKFLPATNFEELFVNSDFDIISDLPGKLEIGPWWRSWARLWERTAIRTVENQDTCIEIADQYNTKENLTSDSKAISPPLSLYVHGSMRPCDLVPSRGACDLRRAMQMCLRRMKPSREVVGLLADLDVPQLSTAVGVLVQAGRPLEPPHPLAPPECDFVKSGIRATLKKSEVWQGWSSQWTFRVKSMIRAMTAELLRDPAVHFFVGGGPPLAVANVMRAMGEDKTSQSLNYTIRDLHEICYGESISDRVSFSEDQIHSTELDRLPFVTCTRFQLADYIALSLARTLLYSERSGAVDYIMAHAVARSQIMNDKFDHRIAIRDGKRLATVTQQS